VKIKNLTTISLSVACALGLVINAANADDQLLPPPEVLERGEVRMLTNSADINYEYTYIAPADVESVTIAISGGTGDADLYVDAPPTYGTDCRPYTSGNEEVCFFEQAQAGYYSIRVHTYTAISDVALMPDHIAAGDGVNVTVSDIDVASGEMKYWLVDVPAQTKSLNVSITGGSGDADLHLRYGAQPTSYDYDCRPYASGNDESCSVNTPAEGAYHIGIHGYTSATGLSLNWRYF
jgi:hypothetical protein